MYTIKQELKMFAKKLIEDRAAIRIYVNEHASGDQEDWLAKAIFNSRIFAIKKACDLLRQIDTSPTEIDDLETRLMLKELEMSM
jgi:hypothetical protein